MVWTITKKTIKIVENKMARNNNDTKLYTTYYSVIKLTKLGCKCQLIEPIYSK